tara:strand:+ start:73 stop:423 length:351 start_codon:yes stop_codon:yes gene_type:complete
MRDKTMKTTFKHIDLNDSVDNFMNHLNNNMDKPDGYLYELNTRGSKYFKVEMLSRGSRSVYCFINKRNGEILKSAGWRGPAKGARGSVLIPKSYAHSDWSGGWLYKIFGNVYNTIG